MHYPLCGRMVYEGSTICSAASNARRRFRTFETCLKPDIMIKIIASWIYRECLSSYCLPLSFFYCSSLFLFSLSLSYISALMLIQLSHPSCFLSFFYFNCSLYLSFCFSLALSCTPFLFSSLPLFSPLPLFPLYCPV